MREYLIDLIVTSKSQIGLLLVLVVVGTSGRAAAQSPSGARQGVVWAAPSDTIEAARDLRAMHAAGVRAVRTSIIGDDRLLRLADSLEMAFYQEVPLTYLPARALQDTMAHARRVLEAALARAAAHPSARHFGLFRYADTSDEATCAYVRAMATLVREQGPEGAQSYYATPFVGRDHCAGAVDLVLVDVLGRADPAEAVRRWRAAHPGEAVGVGALGYGVGRGVSPAEQAHYVERHLRPMLGLTPDEPDVPAVVFAYRWRDLAAATGSELQAPGQQFGLHAADGTPRPAMRVVRGLYTGRQQAFVQAERAPAPSLRWPWVELLCWVVVAGMGVLYTESPRFRRTTQRYFLAHGFYREAVQAGRDVLMSTCLTIVALLSVAVVVVIGSLGLMMEAAAGAERLYAIPPAVQSQVAFVLDYPFVFAAGGGAFYGILLLTWAVLMTVATRWRVRMWNEQSLALIVWTRWPLLLLAVGAAVGATVETSSVAVPYGGYVLLAWLALEVAAAGRTLYDYQVAAQLPPWVLVLVALASPIVLGGVLVLAVGLPWHAELVWLAHVLGRF